MSHTGCGQFVKFDIKYEELFLNIAYIINLNSSLKISFNDSKLLSGQPKFPQ